MNDFIKRIPGYLWSLIALFLGIIIGAGYGDSLIIVSSTTHSVLKGFIKIVPILIFIALSPAVNKLSSKRGTGNLAASVIGWYLLIQYLQGWWVLYFLHSFLI
ncbi:hypothetical protein Ct9H90mP29_01110 [bacterium]|nr:MAG: hypothetical protein Ct9H90mP29_01110 [bacterium]